MANIKYPKFDYFANLNFSLLTGNTPGGFGSGIRFYQYGLLAEAISLRTFDLGFPKLDQIHFSMRRSSLVPGLWSNSELSLTKNRV